MDMVELSEQIMNYLLMDNSKVGKSMDIPDVFNNGETIFMKNIKMVHSKDIGNESKMFL